MIYDNIQEAEKIIFSMRKSIEDLIKELNHIDFPSIISPEIINKLKEDSLKELLNKFSFSGILEATNLSHNYSEVSNIRLTTWTTFKNVEEYFYPSLFGEDISNDDKSIVFKKLEQLSNEFYNSRKNPFKVGQNND